MIVVEEVPAQVQTSSADVELWARAREAGATLKEIADAAGVSREHVRNVLAERGAPHGGRGWVARRKREEVAKQLREWLEQHGPAPAGEVCEAIGISSQRLSELMTEFGIPKGMVMAGEGRHGDGLEIDAAAAAVRGTWQRAKAESGKDDSMVLSVTLYDRYRGDGDPSPAALTSRFGWAAVCTAAGVPFGQGRPDYPRKWSTDDLLVWIGRYAEERIEAGTRVTFDGYDKWRQDQKDAPSGALVRQRLRAAGYPRWADIVNAGSRALKDSQG